MSGDSSMMSIHRHHKKKNQRFNITITMLVTAKLCKSNNFISLSHLYLKVHPFSEV